MKNNSPVISKKFTETAHFYDQISRPASVNYLLKDLLKTLLKNLLKNLLNCLSQRFCNNLSLSHIGEVTICSFRPKRFEEEIPKSQRQLSICVFPVGWK